jgi:hypothetical protein
MMASRLGLIGAASLFSLAAFTAFAATSAETTAATANWLVAQKPLSTRRPASRGCIAEGCIQL